MNQSGADQSDTVSNRNFIVLVVYNIILRTGWIFKTESIVMPAILDFLGGGGWMRGCLPMLNRIGQSVPTILLSDRIGRVGFKKKILMGSSALMGACFFCLAIVWSCLSGHEFVWLPFFFLVVYGFFWLVVGIHNLCLSLLYGKLIPAESRGRLMLTAMTIGSACAVVAAWSCMGKWLSGGNQTFAWLFVFTGTSFVTASFFTSFLQERQDSSDAPLKSMRKTIEAAKTVCLADSNFRCLAAIAACFGMGVTLMPHYQAYVKETFSLQLVDFVPWVIAQNIGAAAISIPIGKIADRWGNRLALRTAMLTLCMAPMLTVLLVQIDAGYSKLGFYVVFFLLGVMPVTMRIFSNYTLEISEPGSQPIYLSVLGVLMAVPVVLMSVLVGWLMDVVNFHNVFLAILGILLFGGTLTFSLHEPRESMPTGMHDGTESAPLV